MAAQDDAATAVDFSKLVTVLVGPQQTRFDVPQDLLTHTSDFFAVECMKMSDVGDSETRVVDLQHVDVKVWNAYLYWIQKGSVLLDPVSEEDGDSPEAQILSNTLLSSPVTQWILAEKLRDRGLRNAVIRELFGAFHSLGAGFTPDLVNLIWASVAPNRALRRLVLAVYTAIIRSEYVMLHVGEFSPQFLMDLVILLMRQNEGAPRINPLDERNAAYFEEERP